MALDYSLVDAWMNLDFELPGDDRLHVDYLFGGLADRLQGGTSASQLVELMDEHGIERAVLAAGFLGKSDRDLPGLRQAASEFPDRFAASIVVDPRQGLAAVRTAKRAIEEYGVRLIRMLGYETQLPYNHAAYFPVYSVCADYGVPVGLNVGLPGPLVPGAAQDPLAIDEVCGFFPELPIVLSHGGMPWPDVCVQLLVKWPNLHYMTSAISPKHIPGSVVHYLDTRGQRKVMWASDYPILDLGRCVVEIEAMPLRSDEIRRRFARENALELFFGDRVG